MGALGSQPAGEINRDAGDRSDLAELLLGRGSAGPLAGDEDRIGQSSFLEVQNLIPETRRHERPAMLDVDVGKDGDVLRMPRGALAEGLVSSALEDALIGDPGAGMDVHSDETGAAGKGYRKSGGRVAAQDVDAEPQPRSPQPNESQTDGHGSHGFRTDSLRQERGVAEVLENDGVEAPIGEAGRFRGRAGIDAVDLSAVPRTAGKRWEMDDADEPKGRHQRDPETS